MEVYEGVADEAKFEWELAAAVNQCQATAFLQAVAGVILSLKLALTWPLPTLPKRREPFYLCV